MVVKKGVKPSRKRAVRKKFSAGTEYADSLRKQLDEVLFSQKNVADELNRQLYAKEGEVRQLMELLSKREAQIRALSSQLESKKGAETKPRKDSVDKGEFSKLANQLAKKDADIARMRQLLLQKPSEDKDAYAEKLKQQLEAASSSQKTISDELNRQLAVKEREIEHLVLILSKKEEETRKLSSQLEAKSAAEESYVSRLKEALLKKDTANKDTFLRLTEQLSLKDEEIRHLRGELFEKRRRSSETFSAPSIDQSELKLLNRRLAEKNNELRRLESSYLEQDRSNQKIIRQLRQQLNTSGDEIGQLKMFFNQEAGRAKTLEKEMDKQLAEKDAEIEDLSRQLRAGTSPETKGTKKITELKQLLKVKSESFESLESEHEKLRQENKSLLRKLDSNKRFAEESEKHYQKLLEELGREHQRRVKELVAKSSEKESELRAEIEKLKVRLHENDSLFAEKEEKIDDALKEFSMRYEQLLRMRSAGEHVLPDPGRIKEEAKIKELLAEAETRVKAVIEKESALERREQILHKQQDAITQQLDVLKAAGFEIGRTKEFLKKKLEEVELPKKQAKPKIERMAPVVEEFPLKAPEPVKQKISQAGILPPEKPKAFTPHKAADEGAFFSADGYSELDEIRSVIEVGLQHGDSVEQIKKSLVGSGYPKEQVEKAARELSVIKK
ncbi:hypothetical protein JXB11_02015 [Candidatus Woesearchaeota archaeon]|nr:hypothetical protein [Candidatus Woesearchaeota archaeon]